VCYGLYLCAAIWVAAGMQKPVDFKADMHPLCLLQTRSGRALKVKRHNASSNASIGKAFPRVVATASVNVSLISRERKGSQSIDKELSTFAVGSAEKRLPDSKKRSHQPSFDVLSVSDDENLEQPLNMADLESGENHYGVLESFRKTHGDSFDALPLLDRTSAHSPQSAERSMFIMHIFLTVVVVLGVLITAIVSACNSRTEKVEDGRAILDHISKTAVPTQPLYGATAFTQQSPHSQAFENLFAMPEVPCGGTSYSLPDLVHMKDGMASFHITSGSGEAILEGVINNEAKDAGILLQQPTTAEAAGMPVAFMSTSRAALAFGNIPIVRPRVDRPQGDNFGILKRIADDKYSVVRKSRTVMVIEGCVAERCLRIHTALADSTQKNHNTIGSTRPCHDADGQARLELHVGSGVDSGLAILCLLTIIRLEASRAAT